jgi:hypothetical protein
MSDFIFQLATRLYTISASSLKVRKSNLRTVSYVTDKILTNTRHILLHVYFFFHNFCVTYIHKFLCLERFLPSYKRQYKAFIDF